MLIFVASTTSPLSSTSFAVNVVVLPSELMNSILPFPEDSSVMVVDVSLDRKSPLDMVATFVFDPLSHLPI